MPGLCHHKGVMKAKRATDNRKEDRRAPADARTIVFRIVSVASLFATLPFVVWMLVLLIAESEAESTFATIALIVLSAFTVLEIAIILKNMKKDLLLFHVAFNENKTLNRPALIIVNVFLAVSIGIFAGGLFLALSPAPELLTSGRVVFPIGLVMLINCVLYDLYVILFHRRRFSVKALLK